MSLVSLREQNCLNKASSEEEKISANHAKETCTQQSDEIQNMVNNYWPWSLSQPKAKGYRNLRHDGLYPTGDFIKAKRLLSPIHTDRQDGRPVFYVKEHSVIRNNVRNNFSNQIRLKFNSKRQDDYRKELERQINERKNQQQLEKENDLEFYQKSFLLDDPWGKAGPGGKAWRPAGTVGLDFLKSMGWSTNKMMEDLEKERSHYKDILSKEYEKYKNLSIYPLNQNKSQDYYHKEIHNSTNAFCDNNTKTKGKIKLSPLTKVESENEDLVAILAKRRSNYLNKIPLNSTDVTRGIVEQQR